MSGAEDWKPSCSRRMLADRAALRQCLRAFFAEREYLEVDTPLLSADIVIDAHLNPVPVELNGAPVYLQTSPEAAMKRLLADGSGSIYQITPAFRADEQGMLHNPEFVMVEWYGVDTSWKEQVTLTEQLVRTAAEALGSELNATWSDEPFAVTTYQHAFRRHLGIDVLSASMDELLECGRAHLCVSERSEDRDDLLNLLLASGVEPYLGTDGPEFLVDYPVSQAALAEVSHEDSRVARRFELYVRGVELCNGYQELTDAAELRRRDELQQAGRRRVQAEELPGAQRLLAAMESGLPRCSGVALGFDRLLMLLTDAASIRECLPFPVDRA